MAGEDAAAEGSRTMRSIDLNLYIGLPPLPPPRAWLDTSAASSTLMPSSITGAAPGAPRTGEPEESLDPASAAAYSPSNALSAPDAEEHPMLDPAVYSWLNGSSSSGGEEYTDGLQPPAPVVGGGANVSGSQLPVAATEMEWDDLLVARSFRPSRWAAAWEVGNRSTLGRWPTQGAPATATATGTEAGAPQLLFLRALEIDQRHSTVRPGSSNNNQEAASGDGDSLARAIKHTYSSFEAATRGQNLDGSCNCNSSFECNICLEVARQPVVTSCGHLFCWPCLYQWLHEQSHFYECPVCKGEVLKGDITPIYGRGGEEQGESSNIDLPPRPQAHRRESLRRQLQMAPNSRELARLMRQFIQNQSQDWDTIPTPAASVPAARRRSGAWRQRRQGNVGSESSNPIQLPHSNGDNAEQVVRLAAPQQSPSVDEPGPSRRSRRSEPPTIRRTRRRP